MPPPLAQPDNDAWVSAMRRGDFEAAWRISDAVLERRRHSGQTCWSWPRHLQYVWTGESLAGRRVLVRCYHGLGDTIQFIRFAAGLRQLAREVVVWSQPAVLDLVATAAGVDRVIALHDGAPEIGYEVDIEIMELPHALRVTHDSLPRSVPYLFPSATGRLDKSAGSFSVGLVWSAGDWDCRRSVPAQLLRRLADLPDVRLFSLQRGAAARSAPLLRATDIGCDDVNETAARMQKLDLIITVDTLAAHLAGALGLPVWTMLHANCDWRWCDARRDCVWYPTMRLFRQRRAGDWSIVVDELCNALRFASSHKRLSQTG